MNTDIFRMETYILDTLPLAQFWRKVVRSLWGLICDGLIRRLKSSLVSLLRQKWRYNPILRHLHLPATDASLERVPWLQGSNPTAREWHWLSWTTVNESLGSCDLWAIYWLQVAPSLIFGMKCRESMTSSTDIESLSRSIRSKESELSSGNVFRIEKGFELWWPTSLLSKRKAVNI